MSIMTIPGNDSTDHNGLILMETAVLIFLSGNVDFGKQVSFPDIIVWWTPFDTGSYRGKSTDIIYLYDLMGKLSCWIKFLSIRIGEMS